MMRMIVLTVAVVVMMALLNGCGDPPPNPGSAVDHRVDPLLVNMPNDMAVRSAIVRQQTLYPFHFEVNGAPLNDLGHSDLAVFADHYRKYPGSLSIRRGDASRELYDARVKEVISELGKAGVAISRSAVADAPARGDGMPSESVLNILNPQSGQQGRGYQSTDMPSDASGMNAGASK